MASQERRSRYTLPGGKPAFSPGWDAEPDVTDAASEADDTRGDACTFDLSVNGAPIVSAASILLSSAGEATVRLPVAKRLNPLTAKIECKLAAGGEALALACTAPPTELDEWVPMPGGKRDMCSLALDVPGFTICFDAASDAPLDAPEDDEDADADAPSGGDGKELTGGDALDALDSLDSADGASATPRRRRFELLAVRVVRQSSKAPL